jgi:integrase
VCRLAGITDKVEVTYTKGGKEHKETREKWELVSTHTARRTGATLLIKAGAPIAWVMRVTGHKSEKTFMRYIRLSAEEYADLVRGFVEKI